MFKKIKRFGLYLIFLGIFLSPLAANAQTPSGLTVDIPDFVPLTPVQGTPFASLLGNDATLSGFFQTLFNLSITIGALLAVLMIAWGGYEFLFSDISDKRGAAKKRIQNALLGLLMLLATVLILRQINPDIVSLKILNNTGTTNTPTQTTTPSPSFTSATKTTEPRGFCQDTGQKQIVMGWLGVGSMKEAYLCYPTLAECAAGTNINNCSAYSTVYNDAYGGGGVRDTPLPTGTADYAIRRWFSGDDPGLNTCPQKGPGWIGLTPDMCGAINIGTGQCCGIPKKANYESVADVPVSHWCYNTGNTNVGTKPLHCSVDQSMCNASRTEYTQSNGPVGLCAQKIDNNGHPTFVTPTKTYSTYKYSTEQQVVSAAVSPINACASPLLGGTGYEEILTSACTPSNSSNLNRATTGKCCALPGTPMTVGGGGNVVGYYPTPQAGKICGDEGTDPALGPDAAATRYACGYSSVATCTTAQSGTLTNCRQY